VRPPFFILSLPRSRSAWLSVWLSYGGRPCWHDMLGQVDDVAGLRRYAENGACGFVETAGSYFPHTLAHHFPESKFLFVVREEEAVASSLNRMSKNGVKVAAIAADMLRQAEKILGHTNSIMIVSFDELNDFGRLAAVWRFLRDDPFPAQYTSMMLKMRVSKLHPFAGQLPVKMLVEEDLLAERTTGATP
jgi:hypothetical protein